ncbi:MAG: oligosaccharide flippase family protein [Laribacter sp.]|nr:oligosaccharide flippase family protein [Laribacter sp.]MBP9527051.1 oligosaccharide flippase family protein [Laribacter sp.]MBP9608211.1 oligosaccharide flippase family protein [Laribacter sp.]
MARHTGWHTQSLPAMVSLTTGAPSLKVRMLKAATWLVGGNISSQLLRLVSSMVLTRLLVPEAFGLVAAINTLYFALVMFSDLGVWQSVVKSDRGTDMRFLGTAWSVQLLRGLLLAAIVLGLALALHVAARAGMFADGTVYADPRLPPMMTLFALCALLQGMESMSLASAQRELLGGHLARLEISTQLGAMLVTLLLAWWTRSVWALVTGTVVGAMLRTLLSHFWLPGIRVRPCWDKTCADEIIGFGKWIFLSSIIGFLAANGEKLILGGSLSTASFGVFSIASTLLAAVVGVYASLNGHVIFSSLSHALRSTDPVEVKRVYVRVQQLVDLLLGGLAGGLLIAGHWPVWLLYDSRYHDAGWMLQWLGLGLLAMRHQVVEQLMFAHGKPAWVSANNALRAVSLAVCIPAGLAAGGEAGAIAGVVVSQFAGWPMSLCYKRQQGILTWPSERWWLPALGAGALAGWLVDTLLLRVLG